MKAASQAKGGFLGCAGREEASHKEEGPAREVEAQDHEGGQGYRAREPIAYAEKAKGVLRERGHAAAREAVEERSHDEGVEEGEHTGYEGGSDCGEEAYARSLREIEQGPQGLLVI